MNWIEILIKILDFFSEVILPLFSEFFGGFGGFGGTIQDWNVVTW